ncbi:MAG: hypothetical protein ABI821_04140 [Pseudomonadota bacterium]
MSGLTIKETRRLVLPLDTVLEALLDLDRRSNGPLSRADILEAKWVVAGDEGGIEIAVRVEGDDAIEWQRFDFPRIGAAIIAYCRAKHIPLPYSGVKSLELTGEGIAFNIENTVTLSEAPRPRTDLSGQPQRYAKGYEPTANATLSRRDFYA